MNKTDQLINIQQSYCATIDYLNNYCRNNSSPDIEFLIGDMLFLDDGEPFDQAAWDDWINAVNKLKSSRSASIKNDTLTIIEAYEVMINFLENYACLTTSDEIKKFIQEKVILKKNTIHNCNSWKEWITSVEKILAQNPLILPLINFIKDDSH